MRVISQLLCLLLYVSHHCLTYFMYTNMTFNKVAFHYFLCIKHYKTRTIISNIFDYLFDRNRRKIGEIFLVICHHISYCQQDDQIVSVNVVNSPYDVFQWEEVLIIRPKRLPMSLYGQKKDDCDSELEIISRLFMAFSGNNFYNGEVKLKREGYDILSTCSQTLYYFSLEKYLREIAE